MGGLDGLMGVALAHGDLTPFLSTRLLCCWVVMCWYDGCVMCLVDDEDCVVWVGNGV